MNIPSFTDEFRLDVSRRCAGFPRISLGEGNTALKHAAVAITLVGSRPPVPGESRLADEEPSSAAPDDNPAAFLLTKRASGLRAHKGQWALPGGRCDPGETPVTTALRELDEECGLTLTEANVLGVLDDYPTRSGYLITPVVVWAAELAMMKPNPQEVAAIYRVGLAQILTEDRVDFIAIPESSRRVIRLHIHDRKIHAPTAAMLYQFRELLAGRHTRVDELEQPHFAWR